MKNEKKNRKRIRQYFKGVERPYVLDENSLSPREGDVIDLQERMNSAYDDTFMSKLESIFRGHSFAMSYRGSDDVEDEVDFSGMPVDSVATAVEVLRTGFGDNLERYSLMEALALLNVKRKEVETNEKEQNPAEEDAQIEQ